MWNPGHAWSPMEALAAAATALPWTPWSVLWYEICLQTPQVLPWLWSCSILQCSPFQHRVHSEEQKAVENLNYKYWVKFGSTCCSGLCWIRDYREGEWMCAWLSAMRMPLVVIVNDWLVYKMRVISCHEKVCMCVWKCNRFSVLWMKLL